MGCNRQLEKSQTKSDKPTYIFKHINIHRQQYEVIHEVVVKRTFSRLSQYSPQKEHPLKYRGCSRYEQKPRS